MIVANTGTVPVTLASGRSLAPGERGEAVPDAEETGQIETGNLTVIPDEQPPARAGRTTKEEA